MKKLKEFLVNALKGFGIGTAMIIPGVSGGTLALILGIYEKLIYAISHFFRKFKESFVFLLAILIGAAVAFLALSHVISYCLASFLFATVMFFFGAVIGGLPMLFSHVKGAQIRTSYIVIAVITAAVVIGLLFTGEGSNVDLTTIGFGKFISLILIGAVTAATMVIPGVSGSAFLMTIGYYTPVLNEVKALTSHGGNIGHSALVIAPFAVGVLLGIFFIAKLIEWLFKKFEVQTYWGIIGFVIASAVVIIIQNFFKLDGQWASIGQVLQGTSVLEYIVGAALAVIGFFFAYKLGDNDKDRKSVPDVENLD